MCDIAGSHVSSLTRRRAKTSRANYASGVRLSRMNDKGEREILDDNQRAAEMKVLDQVIARDCQSPQ